MSKSEAIRSAGIKFVLAAACFGIGAYAIYLALQMVWIFGEGLGIDEASRRLYAQTHVAIHVFGALAAVLIGIFLASNHKVLGGLAIVAMLLCGSYGILNMVGFTASNRISVAAARTASTAADERQYQTRRDDLQKHIQWLRGQSVEAETPRERRRMLTEVKQAEKELATLTPPKPTAANALSDPQSFVLGFLSGLSPETIMLAMPVPAAILLYGGEVLSWIFGVQLLFAGIATLSAATIAVPGKRSRGGDNGGGNRSNETMKAPADSRDNQVSVAMKGWPETPATVPPKPNVVPFKMQQLPSMQPVQLTSPRKVLPGKYGKYTRAEALDDLQAQLSAHGTVPSQATLARRWNVPQPTVSRWLSKWERHVQRVRVGKINAIKGRGPRIGDGGSHHAIHA